MFVEVRCPECDEETDADVEGNDGEETVVECPECGCGFEAVAVVDDDSDIYMVVKEKSIWRHGDDWFEVDMVTPSLFPDVPPLREILKRVPCQVSL